MPIMSEVCLRINSPEAMQQQRITCLVVAQDALITWANIEMSHGTNVLPIEQSTK